LEPASPQAGSIYAEEIHRRPAQDAKPGHVEIKMDKIGPICVRDGWVGKKSAQ